MSGTTRINLSRKEEGWGRGTFAVQKNMLLTLLPGEDRKQKSTFTDEAWQNIPITFPPVGAEDLSEAAIVVEAEIEGYLVKRIHVDKGASVEIMYKQCFDNFHPSIRARLVETHTTLLGFSGEQVKPLGKIELEVCFGNDGLCARTTKKFIVVSASSPYNVILGKRGLKKLRAIPSTIHSMMKFPTPRGIATLVTQSVSVYEFRSEKKRQIEKDPEEERQREIGMTEEVLVNPAHPDQLVTVGRELTKEGEEGLKSLLKKSLDVFSWEPLDMNRIPRRIIEHTLNTNPTITPDMMRSLDPQGRDKQKGKGRP
ncbi:reverse transcriptase domain-containing protein [Artemisia annua]|uniref:Reverse transcriptase domain-containing protein n=1 Tax=Artemisia annua TaxID=35608 RepID=A0A2U1NN55_ARTAN|nr:reverse transcriptase domain-containing protein [Artemisia annua]